MMSHRQYRLLLAIVMSKLPNSYTPKLPNNSPPFNLRMLGLENLYLAVFADVDAGLCGTSVEAHAVESVPCVVGGRLLGLDSLDAGG